MKKLSSRYALLALVALVLGVGLIAANPAQASIQYFDIPDVTIYNTIIDPYNPVIPSGTGWVSPLITLRFSILISLGLTPMISPSLKQIP